MEVSLRGIPVSPGVAIGPAVTFRVKHIEPPKYSIDDPGAELERFDEAVEQVRGSLERLKSQVEEDLGETHAGIFSAHLEMLDDINFRPEIEKRLKSEKLNVEFLVDDQIRTFSRMLENVDDPIFRERSSDLVDVSRRILGALMNRELDSLDHIEEPSIVVAHEMTPSEAAKMDMSKTLGLATDGGGPTSHMAILARAFEIPAVVGLMHVSNQVAPQDLLIVDGTNGQVIIRPNPATLKEYQAEKIRQEGELQAILQAETETPGVTLDGHEIQTLANIELPIEAKESLKSRCHGIGLYRTEYLFMNRPTLPSEEEQYEAYKQVVETMAPLPVTIRTLDIGGDKTVPHLIYHHEVNPQLGWRSIRFCLDRPDIFKAQLRALLRASVHGDLKIMFPMITGVDEFRQALEFVWQVRGELDSEGVEYDPNIKIGTMIEVAAAVAIADKLALECDFFSIGTNDLIQYCLAVDRVNERTAHLYQPAHPGVLRLLKQTVTAAREAKIPCAICGEMAGDPVFTELLIGMGFRALSMSSVSLPLVRAEIANTRLPEARSFAREVLDMATVKEVKATLDERYNKRGSMNQYIHEVSHRETQEQRN